MSSLADHIIPIRQLRGVGGIPTCRRNAGQWLRQRGIPIVTTPSTGGPAEAVDPADLPVEVRAAWQRREAECAQLPPGEYCEELDKRYLAATPKLRAGADRKARMARILAPRKAAGQSERDRYAAVRAEFGEVSDEALRKIEERIEGVAPANYAAVLLRNQKGGPAPVECDPRAWEMLKADFLRPEAPVFTACFARMMDAAKAHGWAPIPTERTLRWRLEREVPKADQVLARKGRKALQQLLPAQRRDRSGFAPCQAVNADGHTFDVFVTAPWRPKPFRPVLVAVQDLYSGMILGWRLGETECWPLVRLAFLDVLRNHGVPERAFLDNGRSFASKWMTGGQLWRHRFKVKEGEPEGLLTSVGMAVSWTTPYHGQAKRIERTFRDLCETIAKHPACAGAYTGNSPTAKPENYGRRAVEWEAFKALVAAEIARHNARPGRKAANCAGRSFAVTYATAAAEAVIARAAPSQLLKFQLAADRVRSRAPSGEVHLGGNRYWAEPLIDLAGKDVVVRFDPEALKAGVHVFLPDGRFVAEAPCIDDVGFADAEAAAQHARKMAEYRRRVRAGLEAHLRMTPAQVAALLPDAPAPAPSPKPAAVRMVAGGRQVTAAAAPEEDAGLRGLSLFLDKLERGEVRLPSRFDDQEDHAETTRNLDRMAATAGRGKSA